MVSPVVVVRGGCVVCVDGRVVPVEPPDVVGVVVPPTLPPLVLGGVTSTVVSGCEGSVLVGASVLTVEFGTEVPGVTGAVLTVVSEFTTEVGVVESVPAI